VEADPSLRRIERTSILACLAMAAAALAIARGTPGPALGVLGGGVLVGVSYRAIRSGVNGLVALLERPAEPERRPQTGPRPGWTVTKLVTRYALLAVLAYVMIARLRLHPVGLLVGASSVVAAASVEALRLLLKK
jgi:hypothetical protein